MNKLYRFRKCVPHSINNLLSLKIEGTKYCVMEDKKEVSLMIDIEKIRSETKRDEEIISRTDDIIRNHIVNSYYIACFATTNQLDDIDMWEAYAGNEGFCLVYDETSIKNAINYVMRTKTNKYILFRDVGYGNNPTDITAFIIDYLSLVGDDIENEKMHKYAVEHVGENIPAEDRNKIINCMFHKIGQFPEEKEKRIVLLGKNDGKLFCNDMLSLSVKPVKIYCSSLMNEGNRNTLKRFAKKHGIEFEIKHIPNKNPD